MVPSACEVAPSPAAPAAPRRTPIRRTFPADINSFPRTDWDGIIFGYPNFRPGDRDLKAMWAARAASNRFVKAFSDNSMEGIDEVDFAVAVLAKASEMNDYVRVVHYHQGSYYKSTRQWIEATDKIISMAFNLAWKHITRRFPNLGWSSDDLQSVVPEFVRPALNCLWKDCSDSHAGGRPLPLSYDAAKFTDRYLPGPGDPELAPRPFTLVNFEPGAQRIVRWYDHKLDEVPAPQWFVAEEAEKIEAQQAARKEVAVQEIATLKQPVQDGHSQSMVSRW